MRRTSMREFGLSRSWNAQGLWRRIVIAAIVVFCLNAPRTLAETPESLAFFESRIRPILIEKCYSCHSSKAVRIKGGLRLDRFEGMLKGGNSGPAVVPGKPTESLLLLAIAHTDDFSKMPPKEKLPAQVMNDFRRWVEMGAPSPGRTSRLLGRPPDRAPRPHLPVRVKVLGGRCSRSPVPILRGSARARAAGQGTPSTPSSSPGCGRKD